jgi:hypothetical protein
MNLDMKAKQTPAFLRHVEYVNSYLNSGDERYLPNDTATVSTSYYYAISNVRPGSFIPYVLNDVKQQQKPSSLRYSSKKHSRLANYKLINDYYDFLVKAAH